MQGRHDRKVDLLFAPVADGAGRVPAVTRTISDYQMPGLDAPKPCPDDVFRDIIASIA